MKKLLALMLLLIIVASLLVSCSNVPAGVNDTDSANTHEAERSYTIHSALDTIEFDTSGVSGTAQIGDVLYVLKQGSVHAVNLSDGSSKVIFEESGLMYIASHGDEVYVADDGKNIYAIDGAGTLINTYAIPEGTFEGVHFDKFVHFISTDDYFVFAHSGKVHTYIAKADLSVSVNQSGIDYVICSYEGNKYWIYNSENISHLSYFVSYDIDKKKLGERYYESNLSVSSMAYDPHKDTVLLYTNGTYGFNLKAFNFEDGSSSRLNLYPIKGNERNWDAEHVTVSDNLYCVLSNNLKRIEVYDMEKEHAEVNIAMFGSSARLEFLQLYLKEQYDINVNVREYRFEYGDQEKINLKLMAGDDDIDLFYSSARDEAYYVETDAFADLYQFEELSENVARCQSLLDATSSYNGKLFGIPEYVNIVDCMEKNEFTDKYDGAFTAYRVKYFNLPEDGYTDDGTALYELLKYYNEHPEQEVPCPEISEDVKYYNAVYFMMNPAARNKDEAVIFLNELIKLNLGDLDDEVYGFLSTMGYEHYPAEDELNGVDYVWWKSYSQESSKALNEAIESAKTANVSDLKKLADDCYNKLRRIIME
ncbi:MAG: extracellular solute-binding protein [Oscillospiraceae bacterium]|nr:extracellular solute-binding protein [Oscillospiraceae bacterium]